MSFPKPQPTQPPYTSPAKAQEPFWGLDQVQVPYGGPLHRKLEQMVDEGRTNYLSPQAAQQIQDWCRQDRRVDLFWRMFTDRVRAGLNDAIVYGLFQALGKLLIDNDKHLEVVRAKSQTEMVALRHACTDALKAFEEAKDRGDPLYMVETMEELDAALYDIEERENRG